MVEKSIWEHVIETSTWSQTASGNVLELVAELRLRTHGDGKVGPSWESI